MLSNSDFKYFVLFVDDFSRHTWVFPIKKKSEVSISFSLTTFIKRKVKQRSCAMFVIEWDRGVC